MPENQKTLRRRIRSIKTTKQITRAMEMVSAAKLRRVSHVLDAARPYAAGIRQVLRNLAEAPEAASHPLFNSPNPGGPALLVVFTPDRGLCGSFNTNLIRAAEQWIEKRGAANVKLFCVGKRGLEHFRRLRAPIIGELTDLGGRVEARVAGKLSDDLVRLFQSGEFSSIHLLYAKFVSNLVNRPRVDVFLPIVVGGDGAERAEGGYVIQTPYLLEPSPSEVFERLVSRYLRSQASIVLAELMTSEHSARMMAMSNATKNCEDLRDSLTLKMNKARQNAITKEMLEIVGGAEALKG